MTDQEKRDSIVCALENCTGYPKCKNCSWEACEEFDCEFVDVPVGLVKSAIVFLKVNEPIKPDTIMYTAAGIGISSCPRCSGKIDAYHNTNYCGCCGQAVKWNE